jgi:hypothetical protein
MATKNIIQTCSVKFQTSNDGILTYLSTLANDHFWGAITLKFEAGRIVHIRKEENFKPVDLSEKPRREYGSESTNCQ